MKRLLNLILFIMFLPLIMIAQEVTYVGNPDDSYFKARELAFAGHHHSARDTLEKILSRYPDYTDVRSLLAKTYSWDANYEEARKHLNRITSIERQNKEAWLAAINNEVYAKNLNIALGLTLKALEYLPNVTEFTELKDSLEKRLHNPDASESDDESEKKEEKFSFDNQVALYNGFDVFDIVYDAMIYGGLEYTRITDAGKLIPRVNYANRFNTHGLQYEMDFYPELSKTFYAYLNYGYSDSDIFPNHRVGVELYSNLPNAMEGSLGLRYLDFLNQQTTILTGSFGLYRGNYYLSLRPYVIPNPTGTTGLSGSLTARKYLKHKENYLGLIFNMGFIPELRQLTVNSVLLSETLFFIESQQIAFEYQFTGKSLSNMYKAFLGLTHQELVFEPGRFFWSVTAGIKYHVRF